MDNKEKLENTQYIFLTKRPENINLKETPDNGWFGVTVTSSKEKTRIDYLRNNIKAKHYHITFEPMFDDVGKLDLNNISWIVIGTETGNRKGKISSKREWVFNIYNQAKEKNIPVFMKEDLLGFLEKDVPFGIDEKNAKKSLYKIADPFMAFYYQFVVPNRSFIELGRRLPLEQALAAHFSEYVSMHWEKSADSKKYI